MQIEVGVDAIFVKLRQKIVQPIDLFGRQRSRSVLIGLPDSFRRIEHVHVVKTNRVTTYFRQMRRGFIGFLMGRKVGSEAKVHAPKSKTLVASKKVPVFDMDEP